MNAGRTTGAGAYARAVESALARIRGRPLVLSPRDWALVSDWHRRGIPLRVVLETLEDEAERSRRRGATAPPRSLAFVAAAVEETWRTVQNGQIHAAGEGTALPGLADAVNSWKEAAAGSSLPAPLRRCIAEFVRRLEAGEDPRVLDQDLDAALLELAPEPAREDAARDVERELAGYRRRMPGKAVEATRRRGIADRLRRTMNLPRLGLRSRP